MVEHNLSVVEGLCDTITVLTRGRVLAEGDYATVSKNPDVIAAYLGTPTPTPMLEVKGLNAWYGESHILHGMDFEVREGRGRHPARPQRRRQDHDDEVDHGPGAAPRRQHPVPRRRDGRA